MRYLNNVYEIQQLRITTKLCKSLVVTNATERGNGQVGLTFNFLYQVTQPLFTCSKLIIETLKQGAKHVQS